MRQTILRNSFCLGCGVTGKSEVPVDNYNHTPEEVPGWCSAEKCKDAKRKFHEIVKEIERGSK